MKERSSARRSSAEEASPLPTWEGCRRNVLSGWSDIVAGVGTAHSGTSGGVGTATAVFSNRRAIVPENYFFKDLIALIVVPVTATLIVVEKT
jgi:hypothetical protein